MKIYLNRNWIFNENYNELESNKSVQVDIPHTVKETSFNYFDESEYQMIAGYQKELFVPNDWKEKELFLTFEGIAHKSEVYFNGNKIKEHHCGYTSFTLKLDNIKFNENNLITVKVNSMENLNIPPFGHVIDYMTYGGIYRDVYLEIKDKIHFNDIFIHSDCNELTSEIKINSNKHCTCNLYMKKKNEIEYHLLDSLQLKKEIIHNTILSNIKLWDIDNPNLYNLKYELIIDNKIVDEKIITYGFRTSEFRKDGYYLNGRKVKIRGLNRHQSYPYVGYAMPSSMQRLDADILKYELGCNAVRTSHYPQSHDFISRCDEIGLLVFTEFPGWQYIGDESWKNQAIENVKDMVLQYRNHPSIIIWGVRINESNDCHDFYEQTNNIAHELDPTRPTGGVRNFKKSELLEDVYTYNDFVHNGHNVGCEAKNKVTSDMNKAYMVTEYNGHMYPTKTYDDEPHRLNHALRHARVLNEVCKHEDIVGSFGWCFADYNTHQDFGSGDRICYHGVLDMFRNKKMAAHIYASQQDSNIILETSSNMEIGEYPASTLGISYIFTNADSIKMYKNNKFIKEYTNKNSSYKYMNHGPIEVDDLVGNLLISEENFTKEQSEYTKYILNSVSKYGLSNIPISAFMKMPKLILKYKMNVEKVTSLYTKYIGNWGENAIEYRFDAIKNGKVIKSITKAPMKKQFLEATASHSTLIEKYTYDVALVQIKMLNEYGNVCSYSNEPIILETSGPIEIIGPKIISLQGGLFGTYVKSKGIGKATLKICDQRGHEKILQFVVEGE